MGNYGSNDIKKVLWIDENIYLQDNEYPLTRLKESSNFDLELALSLKEGFNTLMKYDFELVYVIVSGKLSKDFTEIYEKIIKELKCCCAVTVYCFKLDAWKNQPHIRENYFFSGGVHNKIDDVIEYIYKDECNWQSILTRKSVGEHIDTGKSYGNIFQYVESLETLLIPLIVNKMLTSKKNLITKEEMEAFRNLVYDYGDPILSKLVKPSWEKNIDIPYYHLAKSFVRLYSYESNFYKDMNKYLTNYSPKLFKVFIYVLYSGLFHNIVTGCYHKTLYRAGSMTKSEFNEIKNYYQNKEHSNKSVIYSCKNFLSFSYDKRIIDKYLNLTPSIDEDVKVKIILKPKSKNCCPLLFNIDNEYNLRFFEREIIVLPFSCFEIESIDESNSDYITIIIKHLDNYQQIIDNKINDLQAIEHVFQTTVLGELNSFSDYKDTEQYTNY